MLGCRHVGPVGGVASSGRGRTHTAVVETGSGLIPDTDVQALSELTAHEVLADAEGDLFQLYARAPGTPLQEARVELGLGHDEATAVVRALTELSLLSPDGDGYRAVNPELAEAKALGSEELELAARRGALEGRRALIRSAQSAWAAGLSQAPRFGDVDVVEDAGGGRQRPHALRQGLPERDAVGLPRAAWPCRAPPATNACRSRSAYSVNQGVRQRLLYQDAALRDRATRAYLEEPRRAGRADPGRRVAARAQHRRRRQGRAAADPVGRTPTSAGSRWSASSPSCGG